MAGFDPFEDDGYEEDQAPDEAPAPRKTGKRTTTTPRSPQSKTGDEARGPEATITKKETKPVAETDNDDFHPITLSWKGHTGYDAPLFAVKFKTLEDAAVFLGLDPADYTVQQDLLKAVFAASQKAGAYFISQAPTKTPGENKSGDRYGPPQGATEHPQGKKEFCQHGEMTYKSGVSGPRAKNPGKPYQMFVCGSNVEGCKPKNA